jgi:hypothetical protein
MSPYTDELLETLERRRREGAVTDSSQQRGPYTPPSPGEPFDWAPLDMNLTPEQERRLSEALKRIPQ